MYSYSSCSGHPVDPLNIVWTGRHADGHNVARLVEKKAGWDGNTGTGQSFKSHGGCYAQKDQRNLGNVSKHHMRFFEMPEFSYGSYYTFSDAHRERWKWCGWFFNDAVYKSFHGRSGYDWEQREVHSYFPVRYDTYVRVPHRRRFKQCTGDLVPWNGREEFFIVNGRY